MNVMYFGFVVLLSVCGLRFVGCAPSFTGTPNNGNPVYQLQGEDVTLSWFYNPDGRTVTDVEWSFNTLQLIAAKLPSGAPVIEPAYQGRVQVSGDATIKLLNIQEKDSGKYECRVSFTTSPRRIIDEAELVVVVAPQITLGPTEPITVDEGNSRTLLCVASGNPKPKITWYRGSTKVQEDPNNSNYTITSATRNHAGTYTCEAVVTAPGLSINHAEYTVAVTVRFKPQHKVDSLQSNQTEVEGRNAEFYCRLEAVPSGITYRWFKGGSQIFGSGDYTIDTISDGQRLTVNQVKKGSAGQYSCEGQNTLGTGERKSAYLLVNYAPQQVTVAPVSADVKLGQSRTLTCNADGFPPPSYSWKFNGKLNGIKQNTLTLTNADVNDAGNYTCVAKNGFGSEEFTRVVNVIYRPTVTTFTTGTPGNSVVQGTTVTLTCSANGYPAPTYTIKRGNTVVNSVEGKHVIPNIQLNAESDTYSCEPQNSEGTGPTEQLQIIVIVPPTFSSQLPKTKTQKTENETVSYSCTVEAKPVATIQWILNGQNLTVGTPPYNISSSFTPIEDSKLLKTLAYLTVSRVTWRQNGNFSCLAFNNAGKKSQTTELEVQHRPVVQFPDDHPKNLTLAEGATATFFCKTIGNPATQSHKWQFNGNDIPGESCSGCLTTTYTKAAVTQADAGWYSCTGTNTLGEGPPARAQLLIKHPPAITFFESKYTVNETNNVTMVCRANGVPTPEIIWRKSGSNKELASGEEFSIVHTSGSDDGKYTCTAKNDLGQDSREITLNVRTRPTFVTSTPTTTQIPGAKGEQVDLTCIVTGKPSPSLSWKRQLNGPDLSSLNDGNVKGISVGKDTSVMKVTVSAVGEKFYCVAVNLLGRENQEYTIRERGVPDAPIDVKLVAFKVEGAKTVSVNVSWIPGYSGGYDQQFTIRYRVKGDKDVEEFVGHPDNNMHTVRGLLPNKTYEFSVQATSNQAGIGGASAWKQVKTPGSAVPPDRGSVQATRADDGTVILVNWTIIDTAVTTLSLEIKEGENGAWKPVEGASGMSVSTKEFKVTGLKADKSYRFRMDMRKPGETNPVYVLSNEVRAGPVPGLKSDGEPLRDWMIAVIAAVAGVLLLAIVILALCCFKRRKKARGADNVNMSQTSSYAVGGPDVARALDNRRSYGMESVEDDPFIVAASMQSVNATDGKKKKQDPSVNYGYLSQDSVQQPEMLLNPGSRLSRNSRMAQSTGELDVNSAYPARGPQRDFSTLPPYHEPPTFEEAMRQSGRKPKTRKSTGDLAGPGQGRHSGRRPRQARPADEPTDSSDGEQRFTPQRTAPPPPRVRHVESIDEPGYAAVDQQGRVMGPRVLPVGPQTSDGPRRGPPDTTVPYAMPQKKPKPKKPRPEPHEPAFERLHPPPLMYGPPIWRDSYKGWPPPQYTPEDRSPEEPMLQHPGDLDLDDPSSLPTSERPPDLPPPMAMLPSNRAVPNNYQDYSYGLPEPPAFLRDIVYPPDGGRDPRYDSDSAMPYHPPSPGRHTRPYVNVHGQLVRPSSQDSDGFRRPESLRSSRNTLTPEPEIPPNQWQPRGSESDDRGAPEINYVSYLV
ncbi:hemicentin-2-like isoform X2 [Oculina patagonica]